MQSTKSSMRNRCDQIRSKKELGLSLSRSWRSRSRENSRDTVSHRRLHLLSIRHHVQETFGGIQDIRYDPSPSLFVLASETIPAPLRSSDRKKLRQRVIQAFSLSPEIGELLVPEGLLSVKYTSHSRVPGVREFPVTRFDPRFLSDRV